jgi:hypothetical protein
VVVIPRAKIAGEAADQWTGLKERMSTASDDDVEIAGVQCELRKPFDYAAM